MVDTIGSNAIGIKMIQPALRVRVLTGLLDKAGNYNGCVLVLEDDLPIRSPHVVIARDPDDDEGNRKNPVR